MRIYSGSGQCRGSYLVYQEDECREGSTEALQTNTMLYNTALLLRACKERLTPQDEQAMDIIGCKNIMLQDLPPWAVKFAGLVAQTIVKDFDTCKGKVMILRV